MSKSISGQFYIGSQKSSFTVLLQEALQALIDETKNVPYTLNDFRLIHPYTIDDSPRIFVDYTLKEKYELKLIKGNLRFDSRDAIFENFTPEYIFDQENTKFSAIKISLDKLNMLPVNPVHLIDYSINYIKKANFEDVIDYIYIPFCNEEGTEQPYIHIYFMTK